MTLPEAGLFVIGGLAVLLGISLFGVANFAGFSLFLSVCIGLVPISIFVGKFLF